MSSHGAGNSGPGIGAIKSHCRFYKPREAEHEEVGIRQIAVAGVV